MVEINDKSKVENGIGQTIGYRCTRCSKITTSPDKGDIIFFVPSVNEAIETCKKISTASPPLDLYCIEVYSGMNPEKEELAVHKDKYKTCRNICKPMFYRKLTGAIFIAEYNSTLCKPFLIICRIFQSYMLYYFVILCAYYLIPYGQRSPSSRSQSFRSRTACNTRYYFW